MQKTEIIGEYEKVRSSLENAISSADSIIVDGDEENKELQHIRSTLQQIDDSFKKEITSLENSSEWDRLCMAFFGETNAGKSTIIEALRIIYDEEMRREQLLYQEKNYISEIAENIADYGALKEKIRKLNQALETEKNNRPKHILKSVGLVALGIVAGLAIAFLTIL